MDNIYMKYKSSLRIIEDQEKRILSGEEKLKEGEEELLGKITFLEQGQKKELHEEKEIERNLTFFQKYFIRQAKEHKFFFRVIIIGAIVLVWRGLWGIFDETPILSSFIVSIACGLFLLWVFNKITEA